MLRELPWWFCESVLRMEAEFVQRSRDDGSGKTGGPEQARESLNTLRVVGGLLADRGAAAVVLPLAEARFGHLTLGVLAAVCAVSGVALLYVGWRRIRALR